MKMETKNKYLKRSSRERADEYSNKRGSKSIPKRSAKRGASPSGSGKYAFKGDDRKSRKNSDEYRLRSRDSYDEFSEENPDYIYGINSVREAFEGSRTVNSILVETGRHTPAVHDLIIKAKERKIVVKEVPQAKLKQVTNTDRHQGIVAYMSPVEYYKLEDMAGDGSGADVVVALDEISDVHNMGAILRTVEACGYKYVIIPERRSCQLNSTVAKTSSGAVEHIKTVKVNSLAKALEELKQQGYWIVGTAGDAETDYREQDYSGKIVIVIGSEGSGIRPVIRELCDYMVKIPMFGKLNSLNASVSASILLYEAIRNR